MRLRSIGNLIANQGHTFPYGRLEFASPISANNYSYLLMRHYAWYIGACAKFSDFLVGEAHCGVGGIHLQSGRELSVGLRPDQHAKVFHRRSPIAINTRRHRQSPSLVSYDARSDRGFRAPQRAGHRHGAAQTLRPGAISLRRVAATASPSASAPVASTSPPSRPTTRTSRGSRRSSTTA